MDDAMLRADCARCAALCCVALCFDRSAEFAFDKAAGEACRHLTADFGCAIHPRRAARGMAGCQSYDCAGAGQRVVQGMFGGRDWRAHPELAAPMFEALRILRRVHELLVLLRAAESLPLRETSRQRLRTLRAALLPPKGWTPESLRAFDGGAVPGIVKAFLASLKDEVARDVPVSCDSE
jgi:hypothetical protein